MSGATDEIVDETTNANHLTEQGAGASLIYVDPGENGNLIKKVNSFDVYTFAILCQLSPRTLPLLKSTQRVFR